MSENYYLLIEDEPIDALIASSLLKRLHPSLTCKNLKDGKEALEYLKGLSKKEMPLFILLDLIMPIYDGFDFLEDYQRDIYRKFPDLAVMILSSSVHKRDMAICDRYPFVKEYLIKPLDTKIFDSVGIV